MLVEVLTSAIVAAPPEVVARFLGRRLEYTYEVTEHAPGAILVMRTADGPFPVEGAGAGADS